MTKALLRKLMWFIVGLPFVACGGAPLASQPTPPTPLALPAPVTSQTAARTASPATKSPCETARELGTRTITSANLEQPKLVPFDPESPITGRCLQGKGGTWAIVLTSLVPKTDEGSGVGAVGTFEVFHTDPNGRLTTKAPPPPPHLTTNYIDISGEAYLRLNEPIVFDFDGDGSEELVLYGSGGYHEGESFYFGSIWTFRGGDIVPYAPASNIAFSEVKDVTGDGRPDLLYPGAFDSVVESSCSGFGYRISGPLFVAHARPDGTFATDDDEARAALRKACPSSPAKLVVRRSDDRDFADEEATFANIVCARVWGATTAVLKNSIVRECRAAKLRAECGDTPGTCTQQAEMLTWAAKKPPMLLRR